MSQQSQREKNESKKLTIFKIQMIRINYSYQRCRRRLADVFQDQTLFGSACDLSKYNLVIERIASMVIMSVSLNYILIIIIMQAGHWQGFFSFQHQYRNMDFAVANISVNPPSGTIYCQGSDEYGTFKMEGQFLSTLCRIEKRYLGQKYFLNYVGEVYYPLNYQKMPFPPITKKQSQRFLQNVGEKQKAFLLLQRRFMKEVSQPIQQVIIQGIYETRYDKDNQNDHEDDKGRPKNESYFRLTYVPDEQVQTSEMTNESIQVVDSAKRQKILQDLKNFAAKLAYRAYLIQKIKEQ